MHYELTLGVPATPSGSPLYLFPLRSKRMPLQSLTQGGCYKTNASLGLDTDLVRSMYGGSPHKFARVILSTNGREFYANDFFSAYRRYRRGLFSELVSNLSRMWYEDGFIINQPTLNENRI